jgi:hypothetical protein
MMSKPESQAMEICLENECEKFEDSNQGLASMLAKLLLLPPSSELTVKTPKHREAEIHQTLYNLNFTSFHVK